MNDREKQIEEMAVTLANFTVCKHNRCSTCGDSINKCRAYQEAKLLYEAGYRKMDEVTLHIDLGDCTPEQIHEIMEKFSKAAETPCVAVPNNGEEISKKVAKGILNDLLTLIDNNEDFGRGVFGWPTEEIKMLVKLYVKKKYGIEVDE